VYDYKREAVISMIEIVQKKVLMWKQKGKLEENKRDIGGEQRIWIFEEYEKGKNGNTKNYVQI
jgi:hypothetical protein